MTDAARASGHHAPGHHHGAGASRARLAIAFAITAALLVAEVIGAALTGSLALLVDAGHMVTDAGGLLLALVAAHLMLRPPSQRRTWGLLRLEVLAAGAQAAILLGVGIYALVDGVLRLGRPPEVHAEGLLAFGVLGLAGNVAALTVLAGGRGHSLNLRAAFLEVVNDALGSVAVIVAAVVVATTGWLQADAVAGMLIGLLILPRAAVILREAGSLLLESVPAELDLADIRRHLLDTDHVLDVHDLHVSRIDTGTPVITAHVVVGAECFDEGHASRVLRDLQDCVAGHFPLSVEHSTFQLEPPGHRDGEGHVHS
ncbi:cation transporter [Citricoccus sp. SGAir0253]|uniref:cation diffusion facilitator family transporter n=1 Tax=Citricoccus sp. SGAir0253 TaxID=2567881 RepID=UPI0010CD1A5A|nr:cation diffusion facilitator family transporter [Citricoccus sp. SGAir0253]QCU79073.1 cation transporter [Citricoccus sp. SGAir0253]